MNTPESGNYFVQIGNGLGRYVRHACEATDTVIYETINPSCRRGVHGFRVIHQVPRAEWDEWAKGTYQV